MLKKSKLTIEQLIKKRKEYHKKKLKNGRIYSTISEIKIETYLVLCRNNTKNISLKTSKRVTEICKDNQANHI